jgi:integrase
VIWGNPQRCEYLSQQLGVQPTDDHVNFTGTPDSSEPSRPSTVSQRYDRCARRLGIKTTLHRLRHYSATGLITAGVDIRTVAGRLGHSNGTTTLKVYAAWVSAADQHALHYS